MTITLDGHEVACAEFAPVPGVWATNMHGTCWPVFSVMLTGAECAYVLVAADSSREFFSISDPSFSFVTGPDDERARQRRRASDKHELDVRGV